MTFTPPNREMQYGQGKTKCGCGRLVHNFVLVDCRNIPGVAQDWACDGCWTNWQRHCLDINDINKPIGLFYDVKDCKKVVNRGEWLAQWMNSHGASKDVVSIVRKDWDRKNPIFQKRN